MVKIAMTLMELENSVGALVGSTLSQCRRVDIWSWTMGNRNSYATYLDLDDKDMGQYLYQSRHKRYHRNAKVMQHLTSPKVEQ